MKRTYQISLDINPQYRDRASKELQLGYLNLADGFFEQAEMNFKITLGLDPKCADAYWGLMLVKLGLGNEDELYANAVKYKLAPFLPECIEALNLADKDLKTKYNSLLERIYSINEGDNY